ncbi:serine/threonine-protein phosphatase 6 regulatory ankyrin repeat subunit B-like [Patiria miniata]|uniref:Uncharacterized protein n=1 Tax=Patiria miniata TaxID=46514 RepID=A0A913Z6B7_PATMI|nr:serine/threonine-protein phosphatase 6 regulatory ankyrin repeat subunit B-like [Patiria miniata]XP_038047261.1 serine/threonine-protein phosphatase 6 regulatory ankyrin repeat subunit B-like [Patiria miniata]XP_038047262.1 serine/threonine-protein phosphatase 6 regulatory ankyrin repeat subunit B-like [Patiria miniata]
MQLRPWVADNMETGLEVGDGGDNTTGGTVLNDAGWASPDDVAGVFDILMELDVFLEDQGGKSVFAEDRDVMMVITKEEDGPEAMVHASEMEGVEEQAHTDSTSYVTGACLECVDADVGSALMNTVRNGHAPCLQCIINNFSSVSQIKERLNHFHDLTSHLCPLLEAVERGHEDVVHLFLRFLRDCECLHEALKLTDGKGRMPVHLAAHHDHLGCLDLLLECTPTDRCYWRDKQTQGTPLHHAAAGGAVRCLRRLLKVEDPEVKTQSGRTAVSLAAQAGSVSCLEALIDQAEADPQRADEDGMTPVHYAAQAGHLNCTHWLVRRARCSLNDSRKKDGATAMHLAAGKGRCPILQWALNRELSFGEELDVFGRTPVHYAAEEGQITALRTFAKFTRVHLDAKDFLGRTPSNLAERRGHSASVRFLDSCLQQRHPDGEGALFAKLTRSISSPGGLNNKLVRRNSNRRSGRRKHISSVYLEGKALTDTESGTTREPPVSEEVASQVASALISQVGIMAIAPIVPDVSLHRRIINSLFRKMKRSPNTDDFTVTL